LGRNDDGLTQVRRALALDPLSLVANRQVGQRLLVVRQYDAALDQFRKTVELDPSFVTGHTYLALTYSAKKMYPEAIAEAEKAVSLSEGPQELYTLGYIYGVAGRKQDAQKILDRLGEMAKQRYVPPISYSWVYLGLGDKDQAFQWLDKAVEERSSLMIALKVNPVYAPLRSDPRYQALLRRMGLTP
jgi:tetratricopeptide (TPR) repeat protein